MSQSEYDKLKAEYKEHYQKMKDIKDRVARAKHTQRISQALHDMNPQPVLDSVDEMIHVIKEKASLFEAKMAMAFESEEEREQQQKIAEFELEQQKQAAKDTLNQLKVDLKTQTHSSVQEQVNSANATKTVGNVAQTQPNAGVKSPSEIKKTLGPKK